MCIRDRFDIQREARERVDKSLAKPEVTLRDLDVITGRDKSGKEKEFTSGLLSPNNK